MIEINNLVLAIIFAIFLYSLYLLCFDSKKESFTQPHNYNLVNYDRLNSNEFNYILWDGSKYSLIKVKKPIISGKNPLLFKTKNELDTYLKTVPEKLKKNIHFVDNTFKKNLDDPNDNYEWQCTRELADDLNELNKLQQETKFENDNKKLKNNLTQNDESKLLFLNKLNENKDYYKERCMFKKVITENPNLLSENEEKMNKSNENKFINELNQFF